MFKGQYKLQSGKQIYGDILNAFSVFLNNNSLDFSIDQDLKLKISM